MPLRRPQLGVSIAILALFAAPVSAASFRTQNFLVEAPTPQMAQQFGQMAEQYRKEKAIEWLGQEMPQWPRPCPLKVVPQMGGAGGATTFNYDFRGGYDIMEMKINGDVERMLHSVLPHEITHTVFAHYFRYPVPRWADEGGSVLSEDDREKAMHDRLCRDFLNKGQAAPLRRLFQVKEYQELSNVMVLYAQGYSISNYIVERAGKQAFLGFVATGMRGNWDQAVQNYFQLQSVEQLEKAWHAHLLATKNGGAEIAQNHPNRDQANRLVTRQTAPPAQPLLEIAGTARGQSDDDPRSQPISRSKTAVAVVPAMNVPPPATRSAASPPAPPPPVRLGLPEFGPAPPAESKSGAVGQGN